MLKIILGLFVVSILILGFAMHCCCLVSGKISRMEERAKYKNESNTTE